MVRRDPLLRWFAMAVWLYLLWVLLTWTKTTEQLVYGAVYALVLAVPLSRIGEVGRPWRLLSPLRWPALVKLGWIYVRRLVAANLSLSRRIWSPSLPLRSGMVLFPNPTRNDGSLTALGLITSTVVDNQLIDVHRDEVEAQEAGGGDGEPPNLQYHGVWIVSDDPAENCDDIVDGMPELLDWLNGIG